MIKQSSPSALLSRIAPLALIFLASTHLYAQEPISVSLTGSTVVPPVVTTARGTGQFTITPDHVVFGSIKTFGLVPTMAHIHEAPVGKNGPVIFLFVKTNPIPSIKMLHSLPKYAVPSRHATRPEGRR